MTQSAPAHSPETFYTQRVQRYSGYRDSLARGRDKLSNARLILFLVIAVLVGIATWLHFLPFAILAVIPLAGFIAAIIAHNRISVRHREMSELVRINEDSILRLRGEWSKLPVLHTISAPDGHPYAADLDLFGSASVLHMLETGSTEMGERTLASWLLSFAPMEELRRRQSAVRELVGKPDFREMLALRGRLHGQSRPDPEPFLAWVEGPRVLARAAWLVWAARASVVLFWIFVIVQIAGAVQYPVWLIFAAINIVLTQYVWARALEVLETLIPRERAFLQFSTLLRHISSTEFESSELRDIVSQLQVNERPAHIQLQKLHILASFAIPDSYLLYWPLHILTLWNIHVLDRIEVWQQRNGKFARKWLRAIGEVESLAAFAGASFDHPEWIFPKLDTRFDEVRAKDIGHPLIPGQKRVNNDVRIGPPGTFLLVTGSNMSGKSTLLRAIGVNAVLAGAGGAVCASSFEAPPLALWTSMRVADSLQEGVSFFMAELRRLKQIVDAARYSSVDSGSRMLYLLDEILQGTNTHERQIAARLIIGHLTDLGAIGAVSTHDLTLADDQLQDAAVKVHFTETIADGEMTFDYKLRDGIATSTNALALMRLVGLDVEMSRVQP